MKLITLEGVKVLWKGFKASLSKVAFSGDYNDLNNKPAISSMPESLKNPYAFQANGKIYDGAAAVNMGTVGLAYGGTGATTAAAARTNIGLGAAATQGIANNLTTTAAGAALDARQGKVLKDGQDAINGSLNIIGTLVNGDINKNITFINAKESILGKIQLSQGIWIITATATVQGTSSQKGIVIDVSISGINTNSLMVPDIYKWDTKALAGIVSGGGTFNIVACPYGNLDMDQVKLIGLNAVRIK